jgi:hypothetical protein
VSATASHHVEPGAAARRALWGELWDWLLQECVRRAEDCGPAAGQGDAAAIRPDRGGEEVERDAPARL